jgi:hypothetical protein
MSYDPYTSKPASFGELGKWVAYNEAFLRPTVSINRLARRGPVIPDESDETAFLIRYCQAEYNSPLDCAAFLRLKSKFVVGRGLSETEADQTSIDDVAAFFGFGKKKPLALEIIPAGFVYKGKTHDLVGQPLKMLGALLESRHGRCTRNELRERLNIDDENVEFPEQVIADTSKSLRAVLKDALREAGMSCENPLPSKGKGEELVYILDMP